MTSRALWWVALALLSVLFAPSSALAWEWRDLLRSNNGHVDDGNERMRANDHQGALAAYDQAAKQLPNEGGVHLNRGLALLAAGDLPKARESFLRATEPPATSQVRAAAYYNLGLAFYRDADARAGEEDHEQAQSMFRESADALKRSLRLAPGNRDAAWNLELALRRIREEEKQKQKEQEQKDQQQDQDKQDQQNQDQQNQDQDQNQDQQPQDQDKQDQQNQDQQPQDQDKQDQQKPQDQEQQPQDQQQPEPQAMPQEAERALDALQQSEDNLERMRARQRAGRERRQPTKDW